MLQDRMNELKQAMQFLSGLGKPYQVRYQCHIAEEKVKSSAAVLVQAIDTSESNSCIPIPCLVLLLLLLLIMLSIACASRAAEPEIAVACALS